MKILYEYELPQFQIVTQSQNLNYFKLNFNNDRTINYSFESKSESKISGEYFDEETGESVMEEMDDYLKSQHDVLIQSPMAIKSLGNQSARIILEDGKVYSMIKTSQGTLPTSLGNELPFAIINGLQEDGSLKTINNSEYASIGILFMLPTKHWV